MDFENIKKNYETGNRIARAAAMMTNTTVTRKLVGTAAPRHFNKTIAEVMQSNIDRVGLPTWTEEEQTFAKAVQKVANGNQDGLATKMRGLRPPAENPESGGSDDIGNVSWVAPTAALFYPANIPNLPGHNWANAIAMATPIAHKGVTAGAKAQAMTMLDLYTKPSLLTQSWDFFRSVQTADRKYTPLMRAGDKPAIWLNRDIMARYRPEMRKYYYDPAKYKTYLEQLGITYPTVKPETPVP